MDTSRRLAMLSSLLAALGAVCLVAVPLMRQAAAAAPSVALQLEVAAAAPARAAVRLPRRGMIRLLPGQQLVGGTETYPYWEREYTGDPEAFADDYIDFCIRKLYPEVGCPGAWDSKAWNPIRE